ncbi:MAG TPA: hypothetical protein VFY53_15025, partial [Rhodoplanes sp.]|nr:hypothetical protein [Rhodoplanes sp.]
MNRADDPQGLRCQNRVDAAQKCLRQDLFSRSAEASDKLFLIAFGLSVFTFAVAAGRLLLGGPLRCEAGLGDAKGHRSAAVIASPDR